MEHGYSLTTLFNMTANHSPMILIIKTLEKSIFGAYLSCPWPTSETDKNTFTGTGETFLFTIEPFAKMYPWVGRMQAEEETSESGSHTLMSSTAEASLFIMSGVGEVCVGGGGGELGLWLNATLTSGTTGKCLTFNNDMLTGTKTKR